MPTKNHTRYSLLWKYTGLVILISLTLLLYFGEKCRTDYQEMRRSNLEHTAKAIDLSLHNHLLHMQDRMRILTMVITNIRPVIGKEAVDNLLKIFSTDSKMTNTSLWGNINWIDKNHLAQLDNTNKLLVVPIVPFDISNGVYIDQVAKQPFQLYFSPPKVDYIGRRLVLPSAMVVNNRTKGSFLGTLTANLDVEYLSQLLTELVAQYNTDYAIVSSFNNQVLLKSPNFDLQSNIEDLHKLHSMKTGSKLDIKNDKSFLYKKIDEFPFMVITETKIDTLSMEEYIKAILLHKTDLYLLLLLIIAASYLFYRGILDPFMKFSDSAWQIANGNLAAQIPILGNENSIAAAALEKIKSSLYMKQELVQDLSEARNRLSVANTSLETNLNERTLQYKTALEEKTNLLHKIINELNMPMESIVHISHQLLRNWGQDTDEKRINAIQQLKNHSQNLLHSVHNIYKMSNFSNANIALTSVEIELTSMVENIIDEFNTIYAMYKKIEIALNYDENIRIMADKRLIRYVIRNILIYAIQNSLDNEKIIVDLKSTEITDSYDRIQKGVCIKFIINSIDPAKAIAALDVIPLCKEIISAHQGQIIENTKNELSFALPLAQSENIENEKEHTNSVNYSTMQHAFHKQTNILLIDDEEICLNSMELLLNGSQYNLITVNGGQKGLQYLEAHYNSIALVLLDLMMPDMYGLNVLIEMKRNKNLAHIPVILQSCTTDGTEIEKAFKLGIACYIKKPYQRRTLLNELKKLLGS